MYKYRGVLGFVYKWYSPSGPLAVGVPWCCYPRSYLHPRCPLKLPEASQLAAFPRGGEKIYWTQMCPKAFWVWSLELLFYSIKWDYRQKGYPKIWHQYQVQIPKLLPLAACFPLAFQIFNTLLFKDDPLDLCLLPKLADFLSCWWILMF